MRRGRALALLVVVAMSLSAAACASEGGQVSSSSDPALAVSRSTLAGNWTLTDYRVAHKKQDISADGHATLTISREGRISADDLTNAISGRFVLSGRTISVRDTESTAVGVIGGPRRTLAEAVNVFFVPAVEGHVAEVRVAALGRHRLTVTSEDKELRFSRR